MLPTRRVSRRARLRVHVMADGPTVYRAEMWLRPGPLGPPMHRHPGFEERVRVQSGRLRIRQGEHTRRLRRGDEGVIPPGEWHNLANRWIRPARFITEVRPAGSFRTFFDGLSALSAGIPRPAAVAVLFRRHRAEIELRPLARLTVATVAVVASRFRRATR